MLSLSEGSTNMKFDIIGRKTSPNSIFISELFMRNKVKSNLRLPERNLNEQI